MNDLEYLLNLNDEIYPLDNGYWVKFEARRVEKTTATLHDKRNHRVIGYDNAHSFKSSKKYSAKKETWDHIHKKMDIVSYEFESASQLMEDFWNTSEHYMDNN